MSAKNRNPFLEAAVSVVKGAICTVLDMPTGRSTKSVAFEKDFKARLTVGPVNAELDDEQKQYLDTLIKSKVLEDVEFTSMTLLRSESDRIYGEGPYDDYGVPQSVQKLRLVYLPGWNINCNINPVVRSTGLLGEIGIEKYKFNANKQTLEMTIFVNPTAANVANPPLVEDTFFASYDGLPTLADLTPLKESANSGETTEDDGQNVTPWEVQAGEKGVDYDKLIKKFGCSKVTQKLIDRIGEITGTKPHHFLRRGLFFSHRDLDTLLNAYQKNIPFYLYTGRGPASESLHVGHLIPFMFTRYLQKVFKVPLVIQLTDDEKFLFKEGLTLEETHRLGFENAKDIIACGFDPELTFIFRDLDYIRELYPTVLKIQKKVTYSTSRAMFGFQPEDNIGKSAFPAVQAAPSFPSCFPTLFGNRTDIMCLIPQAIDQDPYFRMTRDIAPKLGFMKPALIHSRFIPSLMGNQTKMSGSVTSSSLYVTDSSKEIENKIMKYAFSGGQQTAELHRELGANLEVDVAYQYLRFFMEDDEELERIGNAYKKGEMLSSEVKQKLVQVLNPIISEHKKRRAEVSDDVVRHFMNPNRASFAEYCRKLNEKKQ